MRLIVLLVLSVASTLAAAQPYAFAGFGSAKATINAGPGYSDDTGGYFSAGGGYRFSRHLSLEASYMQTGEASTSSSVIAGGTATGTGHEAEMRGIGLAAIGSLPLGERFSVFAKGGLTSVETTVRTRVAVTTDTAPFTTLSVTDSETSDAAWAPTIGLGAAFAATPDFTIRATFEQTGSAGPLDKLKAFSVQAVVLF